METKDYLNYVVHEIHRTIVATVDDEGLPVTAAIDMMDCDDNSLYFLTAKGKGFYDSMPAELHYDRQPSICDRAGSLPALRRLPRSLPDRCGG